MDNVNFMCVKHETEKPYIKKVIEGKSLSLSLPSQFKGYNQVYFPIIKEYFHVQNYFLLLLGHGFSISKVLLDQHVIAKACFQYFKLYVTYWYKLHSVRRKGIELLCSVDLKIDILSLVARLSTEVGVTTSN